MNDCLTFSPSDKTLHRKGVFKSPPLKAISVAVISSERFYANIFYFGFFKNPALKPECDIIELYRIPHISPPSSHWTIPVGFFMGVRICDILHHIIHFTYFEHLVFNQMLFFVVSLLLILRLSTFCADENRRCKRVYITTAINNTLPAKYRKLKIKKIGA